MLRKHFHVPYVLVSQVKVEGSNCLEKKSLPGFLWDKILIPIQWTFYYTPKKTTLNFLGNRHSYVENTKQIKKNIFDIYLCTTCWKNFKHHLGLISELAMRLKIIIQYISNHSIHNKIFLLILFFQVFEFSICKVFLFLRFLASPFSLMIVWTR